MENSEPAIEIDPDRPQELPMSELQAVIAHAAERIELKRVRHRARSAFSHIKRAWRIKPTDPEMSLFRAITAEEEAATSLMLALQQQNYPGASRLAHRNHVHKAAIWPFMLAIVQGMRDKGVAPPVLSISKDGEPRISLSMDIGALAGLDHPLWATPDHPFNFVMHSDENGPFEIHRWERELLAIASDRGLSGIKEHIRDQANERNRILYASDEGIPAIRFPDSMLEARLLRVCWLTVVTISIMQTPAHQLFLVQAVEGFLKMLDRFEGDEFDFLPYGPPREGPYISLVEQVDGTMELSVRGGEAGTENETN